MRSRSLRLGLATCFLVLVFAGPQRLQAQSGTPVYCTGEIWGWDQSLNLMAHITNQHSFWIPSGSSAQLACGIWLIQWADEACGVHGFYQWSGQGTYSPFSPAYPQPMGPTGGYC